MPFPPRVVVVCTTVTHHIYIRVLVEVFRGSEIAIAAPMGMLPLLSDVLSRNGGGMITFHPVYGKESFSEPIRRLTDGADIVVIDEMFALGDLAAFARWKTGPGFFLTVHNINSWFFPRWAFSLKKNLISLHRKIILRKFRNIVVVGSALKEHLDAKDVSKRVLHVPAVMAVRPVPDPAVTASNPRLRVVVPGTVSERRDYGVIIDSLCTEKFKSALTLVLLGPPSGEYGGCILDRCREKRAEGYDLVTFDRFVPGEVFESELMRADVILSVFDIRYETVDGQVEVYGTTKISAIPYLAHTRGKPVILPRGYVPPMEMASQIIPYDSPGDIPRIVSSLLDDPDVLRAYSLNAFRNASSLDAGTIRRAFIDASAG